MIVYTLPDCDDCSKLKNYLDEKNVDYESIDISEPGNIRIKKIMKSKGFDGVPIIETEKDIILGVDLGLVDVVIKREHKYAKEERD